MNLFLQDHTVGLAQGNSIMQKAFSKGSSISLVVLQIRSLPTVFRQGMRLLRIWLGPILSVLAKLLLGIA
jgi:hypothetical protein